MTRCFFPKTWRTPAVSRFYLLLKEAVPEFEVFSRAYPYQAKIVDFTIIDTQDQRIVCLIQLDDPTQDSRRAGKKDVAYGGRYRTIRWGVRELPPVSAVRDKILQANEAGPLEYVAPPEWARPAETQPTDFRGRAPSPLGCLKRSLIYLAVVVIIGSAVAVSLA